MRLSSCCPSCGVVKPQNSFCTSRKLVNLRVDVFTVCLQTFALSACLRKFTV